VWRRFREWQGVGSIDHFHHQLRLLEQAGPKRVAPAYRLHTAVPNRDESDAAAMVTSSRPRLVLLRPTDDEQAADVDDDDGCHYERVGVLDPPEPVCAPEAGADLPAYRRELARRRCTVILRVSAGVAILTGLIGIWLHVAWVFTALSGVAALALVGLIAYAKEVEAELRRRRDRRERRATSREPALVVNPAAAGYPGAWDDDAVEMQVAAR
jgi:hypothetical protein